MSLLGYLNNSEELNEELKKGWFTDSLTVNDWISVPNPGELVYDAIIKYGVDNSTSLYNLQELKNVSQSGNKVQAEFNIILDVNNEDAIPFRCIGTVEFNIVDLTTKVLTLIEEDKDADLNFKKAPKLK